MKQKRMNEVGRPQAFVIVQQDMKHKPLFDPVGFFSCTDLFPKWIAAKVALIDFCRRTSYWCVSSEKSSLNLSLGFPNVTDELTGVVRPMVFTFPPEERSKVIGIMDKLLNDYTPNLDKFLCEVLTKNVLQHIRAELQTYESYVVMSGGRLILDEMAYRLGIKGFKR